MATSALTGGEIKEQFPFLEKIVYTNLMKKPTPEMKAFIKGKTDSVSIPAPKPSLGFSPAERHANMAGFHEKTGRARHKAARKAAKMDLR